MPVFLPRTKFTMSRGTANNLKHFENEKYKKRLKCCIYLVTLSVSTEYLQFVGRGAPCPRCCCQAGRG